MKYISICSGIEAASVAWHGLGWTPLAFSEIEAFPSAVLAHHWPDVPNLGDMTKFADWPEEILAECDLLVGGPPCQAFSVAGLRKSLQDERGNVTLAYVRLLDHIDEVRRRHGRPPVIAVYENVPGLLSTKDNAFGCLIGALCGCDEAPETETGKWPKAGFLSGEARRVGYRVLDAQYFGVAQRRRRIFLVAVPCELVERFGERACPSEILSLRESVRGNPPARRKAWEGAARTTASGLTSSGRGVERAGESRGQDDVVISRCAAADDCYPTPDAQMDRKWGSNQWVNNGFAILQETATSGVIWSASDQANAERLVDQAGTLNCNKGQRGWWISTGHTDPAYAISAGSHGKGGVFGSGRDSQDTFVSVAFKPSHFTRGKDGSPQQVTPPLSADADKGDQDTVVCATGEITHALTTRAACEEDGTGRGNPIVPQAIAFHPTQDPISSEDGSVHAIGTGSSGGCATAAVAFTKSKRAQHKDDDESWVPGRVSPTVNCFDQGDARATTVVAFTQNIRDEARQINGDGSVAGSLSADAGMHQTSYIAQAFTHSGYSNKPAWITGDRTDCLPSSGHGDTSHQGIGVMTPMQVRRLTPTECCRLQGFPDTHCDITFRKKPAADGPKYRALGNSMAVPCMWWIGIRIQKATTGE